MARAARACQLAVWAVPALAGVGCSEVNFEAPFSARDPELEVSDRPIEQAVGDWIGSDACRACHPAEYESWQASFHRTMTQVVTPETALVAFEGTLEQDGKRYRLFERDGGLYVELPDPAWEGEAGPESVMERPIVMSTGSHHFQAYWYPHGDGRRLNLLPFCYRIDEGRWMPIDSAFLFPPEQRQRTDTARWNTTCNKCHATRPEPRLHAPDAMDTRAAEFGIACEACHGPGREHVARNRNPTRRYGQHWSDTADPTIVQPGRLGAHESAQVCGQCHGISVPKDEAGQRDWAIHGFRYRAGEELEDSRRLVRSGETYFWDDGVIRVSGREYMGLTRSPCYEHGDASRGIMTCTSCHVLHKQAQDPRSLEEWRDDQLGADMRGDAACLACHDAFRQSEQLVAHTRHAAGSSGSRCYNCHMPHTTWGLMKAMRTHQVTSPSVDESVQSGRPNACNLCHLDRPLAWTGEVLERWYGIPTPELNADETDVAASVQWLLSGDAAQRALLAWHLGWKPAQEVSGDDWMGPFLAQLLADPYDVVRFRAYRSLRTLPGFGQLNYDFVAPPAELRRVQNRAFGLWAKRTQPTTRSTRRATLIDRNGGLRQAPFRRLLGLRDDRPVRLEE